MNILNLYLTILQQENYETHRLLKWIERNPDPTKIKIKKPLVVTGKIKVIKWLLILVWPLTKLNLTTALILILKLLRPVEWVQLINTKRKCRAKVQKLKKDGLIVIGVAGSFGKTTTKEFLYQMLRTKYRVIRTPESYNTPRGVAKVVDLELYANVEVFICEMGEHGRGDIAELCEMVLPDFGIITGIGDQHLERFGTIKEIRDTVYELAEYVPKSNLIVADETIKGTPADINKQLATQIALKLGISEKQLKEIKLKTPEHRLSVRRQRGLTILDDAYSSNTSGFVAAVEYLKSFNNWKVIITPGIVELGTETFNSHVGLGNKLRGVDQVILVGISERTRGLEKGFAGKVEYVENIGEGMKRIKNKTATVLWENDLPDNY